MLQLATDRPLATCLQMDFRIVSRMVCGPSDFWEGVRATLIDRDRNPTWLEPDVRKARIGSLFVLSCLSSAHGRTPHESLGWQVMPALVGEFFEQLADDQELRLPPAILQQKYSARM